FHRVRLSATQPPLSNGKAKKILRVGAVREPPLRMRENRVGLATDELRDEPRAVKAPGVVKEPTAVQEIEAEVLVLNRFFPRLALAFILYVFQQVFERVNVL